MSATTEANVVLEPGVYDLSEDVYHADPCPIGSLSVSGAKRLLPPSCPAVFRYERDHPRDPSSTLEFGTAAHRRVLGVGQEIVGVDAKDWRTKAAQEAAETARAQGAIPLLSRDVDTVNAMEAALRSDPIAAKLLEVGGGKPEASLFCPDPETGVMRRGRLDWLPNPTDGRLILTDYKTAASAHPETFAKAAANYGYHMQAAWYLDLVTDLALAEDVAFVFIVQEKCAPYLVSVVELDFEALRIGRNRNRYALDLYAECVSTDTWPSYTDDVALVSLPGWAERAGGLT